MRKDLLSLACAASLAVGGMVCTFTYGADDATVTTETRTETNALILPAGFQEKKINEDKDVKKELARVTEDGIGYNKFDNLIGNFVDQDRTRMKDVKNEDVTKLNEITGDIKREWKAKYGNDFDIKKVETVFDERFTMVFGEVTDPDVAMSNWPVAPDAKMAAKPNDQQGHAEVAGQVQGNKSQINLDKGRNVALVRFPASHGLPGLTISLIHEMPDQWRIDVPNNISGQQVHDNLMKQVSMISQDKDKWPADENEAYRLMAHRVLMAIENVDANMQHGDQSKDSNAK